MEVQERIQAYGFDAINNLELVSMFVPQVKAAIVLNAVDNKLRKLAQLRTADLTQLGLTFKESTRLFGVFQLIKRTNLEDLNNRKISGSKDVFEMLSHTANLPHEEFHVLYMNRAGFLIKLTRISVGGQSGCVVDPKVIFAEALSLNTATIIMSHNHPSGNLQPSQADLQITKKIQECGKMLDIFIADHVIIGGDSFYSFADEGMM